MSLTLAQQNGLARRLQHALPLVNRPFADLANELKVGEGVVVAQVRDWMESGTLREISVVLEGSAFGYDSALVAGEVPAARVEAVAAVINEHPTVSHNYLRDHRYNLWFTIAVPPRISLEETLELLARATRIPAYFALRRTHTFKVGVNFDLLERRNETAAAQLAAAAAITVGPREEAMFRALQTPLPPCPEPFARLAALAETRVDELLDFARRHLGGAIRRYVGTFRHRRLGVHGNGMVVWNVTEERLADLGERLAGIPEVSHCYARNPIPGFPYRLYSMVHGPDGEACDVLAARLAGMLQVEDYRVLQSQAEFKKCRLRYFLPELDVWQERQRNLQSEAA